MNSYYNYTSGQPPTQQRALSASIRAEFTNISAGFDDVQAAILAVASGGLTGLLPSQTSNAGRPLITNGTSASWSQAAYFDPVTNKAGFGTVAPTARLTATDNTGTLPAAITGTVIHSASANGVATVSLMDSFGGSTAYVGRAANGTSAAPSALAINSLISSISAVGYGATHYSLSVGLLGFYASQAWSDNANGTYADIWVTPNGSTSPARAVRVDQDGAVLIGTTSNDNSHKLQVVGGVLADNLAVTTITVNGQTLETSVHAAATYATIANLGITTATANTALANAATAQAAASAAQTTANNGVANAATAQATASAAGTAAGLAQTAAGNAQTTANAALPALLLAVTGVFKNLQASATGTSANISVSADAVTLDNGANSYFIARPVSLTIAANAAGANGLDTGALAGSTWYSVWVIYNGATIAGLISTSATAPTMPNGYTYKARIGWIRTDGTGNKFPLSFSQFGNRVQYKVASGSNVTALPILGSGAVGSTSVPTWVAVSTANFVPSTAGTIRVIANGVDQTSAIVMVAPNNSYGAVSSTTNPPPLMTASSGTSNAPNIPGEFLLETTNIYWASNNGNVSMTCLGWVDNI